MSSGQKFIGRNRAPRVQIEYDLETYGSRKKIELPFVMGVMADLSGKPKEKLEPVASRKFLEIDVDNFNKRMKAMKPRVDFRVPNTLTGKGELKVDMTFDNMEDFKPAAIAAKVNGTSLLYEVRQRLATLLTYMDGKPGAESLIGSLLEDKNLLGILRDKNANATELLKALKGKDADSEDGTLDAGAPSAEGGPVEPTQKPSE